MNSVFPQSRFAPSTIQRRLLHVLAPNVAHDGTSDAHPSAGGTGGSSGAAAMKRVLPVTPSGATLEFAMGMDSSNTAHYERLANTCMSGLFALCGAGIRKEVWSLA